MNYNYKAIDSHIFKIKKNCFLFEPPLFPFVIKIYHVQLMIPHYFDFASHRHYHADL